MNFGFFLDIGPVILTVQFRHWRINKYEDEYLVMRNFGPIEYIRHKNVTEKSTD